MTALVRWYIGRSRVRAWATGSLALLALYATLAAVEATLRGHSFAAMQPWRLGGSSPRVALAAVTLALGLSLGWLVPGLCLALLSDRTLSGPRLLGRAFGLGTGYLLVTGLAFALLAGQAPGRGGLLVLLSLPPLAALLRSDSRHDSPRDWTPMAALLSMTLVTAALWPKLAWESLNGDGTEAHELARSLDSNRMPRWDLERPDPPGRYGYPAVNPFLTNSYLVHAEMVILGRAELATRLPFPVALVACAIFALALSGRGVGSTAVAYVAALAALSVLWNAYYVSYEPAFADLAEPAATDLLMTALWLAGALEIASGSRTLGVGFLLLASGVLYSAPLLATLALMAFAFFAGAPGRRALGLWTVGLSVALVLAFAFGLATGSLPDWVRQIRSEYWEDFTDPLRRTPTLPLLGRLLLATGALPLVALLRFRQLSPLSRALLVAAGVYLALVAASQAKNLHYLTPLPFLLAPAALEASQPRLQASAAALIVLAFALSWPSPMAIHRDGMALGRRSCLGGVDLEAAALGGDVIYAAFSRPGSGERFGMGKHTFVRYAFDRGGRRECRFRLSPHDRSGWVNLAGADLKFSTRDLDEYAAWRFSSPEAPASLLFPQPAAFPLPTRENGWLGRHSLADLPGSALLLDGFARHESRDPGNPPAYAGLRATPARLLVPLPADGVVRLRAWAPEGGLVLAQLVNGRSRRPLEVAPGWSEITLATSSRPWRTGWNVLELSGAVDAQRLALDWIDVGAGQPELPTPGPP